MSNIETESQSASPRNPVIDLEAEELSEAADTGDEAPPKSDPPPEPKHAKPLLTRGRLTLLAIIAAVIVGAGVYATFSDGFWSGGPSLGERVASLEASNHTLNGQLNEMGQTIGTLRADTKKLVDTANAKAEEAAGKADAASQGVASFDSRLAEAEKNLSALRTEIAGLGTATGGGEGPSAGALAAIETRLAALEDQVKALEANQSGGTSGGNGGPETAALSQALSDLKAKFAGGASYKAEIDVIAKALPNAPGLAELGPHAEKGIASAEGLGAALEALAPDLPKSSGESGSDGGILSWLGTIVTIRDLDARDWGELALAAAKDAKAGDLRAAIRRLDEMGAEIPAKLAEWRALAETRLQAEAALDRLSAAVIAAIAGKS
jgi:hypothetical protein